MLNNEKKMIMALSDEAKIKRNKKRRELHANNIRLLGGRCSICNTTEKIEIHHRWYLDEDKGTHHGHMAMNALIKKQPERFSCLCRRCNTVVGHVCNSIMNSTFDALINEAHQMTENRKINSGDILTQKHVLKRNMKCPICGKMMAVRGMHQKKFCSRECELKDRRENRTKQYKQDHPTIFRDCVVCSKTFQKQFGGQITCSQECGKQRTKDLNKQKYRQAHPAKFSTCIICDNEFQHKAGGNKTCSKECSLQNLKANKRNHHKLTHPSVFLKCIICGIKFKRRQGPGKTCDSECQHEWEKRKRRVGFIG